MTIQAKVAALIAALAPAAIVELTGVYLNNATMFWIGIGMAMIACTLFIAAMLPQFVWDVVAQYREQR